MFWSQQLYSKDHECLCDPCELRRRQTIILLSRLLQVQFFLVFCYFWCFSLFPFWKLQTWESIDLFLIIRETTCTGRSAIPSISFVTCWQIRKDKTTCSLWKYFERWKGSHKQLYLQSLKLVLHVCCWVLTLMYNLFAVKAPLLAYNSFAEAIFILNASLVHNGHADFQGSRV